MLVLQPEVATDLMRQKQGKFGRYGFQKIRLGNLGKADKGYYK